jgi:hypothetical protein
MRGPVCSVPFHLILRYLPGDHLEYFEDKVKHLRSFHRSYSKGSSLPHCVSNDYTHIGQPTLDPTWRARHVQHGRLPDDALGHQQRRAAQHQVLLKKGDS